MFWPGEFHGLYGPWGHKESDTTEWLSLSAPLTSKGRMIIVGPVRNFYCELLNGQSVLDFITYLKRLSLLQSWHKKNNTYKNLTQDCHEHASYIRQEGRSLHFCLFWGVTGIPAEGFNTVFSGFSTHSLSRLPSLQPDHRGGGATGMQGGIKETRWIANEQLQGYYVHVCKYIDRLYGYTE